jgi:hypothetical protein
MLIIVIAKLQIFTRPISEKIIERDPILFFVIYLKKE